jgi:uncharacterized membrane protein (UPF0127 family)
MRKPERRGGRRCVGAKKVEKTGLFKHSWGVKRMRALIYLLSAATLAAGCGQSSPPVAPPVAAGSNDADPPIPGYPTEAQPKLATIKLWIGAEEMTAEMALTGIQEETGMMFRTNMGENEGMIFVMPAPQEASFWMHSCPLPLSCAYIDTDGHILEIHDLQPHNTNAVLSATANIQFVLETPQGWFQRHNIKTGTVIATEKGSLKKTFLGQ